MTIRSIWAQAPSGAIGDDGGMLWHVPEDMAFFKRATVSLPVIMGRRTWEAFPDHLRPLPERPNVVITRDADYEAPGAETAATLEQAIVRARVYDDEVWVIGGGEIYRQAMDLADELWVTDIDLDVDGDTHAPAIGEAWEQHASWPEEDDGWLESRTGTRYRFRVYTRRG
ncbi:dihydrofolate reductase [Microbacterium amylolyticum]|uniref:Dihydrofolate reductase n=1 Tax=Microbacterium amylolyticum TaxID=936337 RepID=A0ABS4ZGI8_9MICO|nr:dihydrofolate reductase [Microbacterium amylolyticum]MBP2436158.1 dihydrofolate reductase [Microbacterium amylolyticum]